MSLTVSQGNSGNFEIVPEGTYIARCYKVIDLGTQTVTGQYGTKQQQKVNITWELLDDDVKMQDGRPFATSKKYTASLHEKAQLRKDLEAWRGKKFTDEELEAFDLKNILGTYCMLQIVHVESGDKTYANVNAIMSTKQKPKGVNDDGYFDIDAPDMAVFDSLSDFIKKQIQESAEFRSKGNKQVDNATDVLGGEPINLDEIPY